VFDVRHCTQCKIAFTAPRTVGHPRLMCGALACQRRAAAGYSRTYRERMRIAA
jgi:hypothetical protein